MDILMIGNGFDIEHGLTTTYTDFLQFVERFHHVYTLVQIKSNTKSNVEEMWNLLIELSRGAADKISRETLEELLQNTESSWEICNYTHLLREIEEYDYFSEQAQNEPEDFGEEF